MCTCFCMGLDTNSCEDRETVVAKATAIIEAESEIGTARNIAEFPMSVLQSTHSYSYRDNTPTIP